MEFIVLLIVRIVPDLSKQKILLMISNPVKIHNTFLCLGVYMDEKA